MKTDKTDFKRPQIKKQTQQMITEQTDTVWMQGDTGSARGCRGIQGGAKGFKVLQGVQLQRTKVGYSRPRQTIADQGRL